MDGREFIQQSPLMAWKEPFESYITPVENKKREKEARRRREAGQPFESNHLATNTDVQPQLVQHYIMNLPDSALEFLNAFKGLYDPLLRIPGWAATAGEIGMPMIHVYCFTKELEMINAQIDICQVCGHWTAYVVILT